MSSVSQDAKFVELSRLAGGLAHEIRNPLSTLNLNLQLLDEDLSRADDGSLRRSRERIDVLRREVQRLSDILDDFLRFARMPKPHRIPCDVNGIVKEVLRFLGPEARRNNVNLLANYGNLPLCMVDKDLLKQALLNLLLNAEQAMPDGGDIMVRTTSEDDEIRISIADTGHGIPPDVLPKIFDPYFSTKKEGTGLGLSMVKRIAEEHGGRIQVHPNASKGACFDIILPVVAFAAPN